MTLAELTHHSDRPPTPISSLRLLDVTPPCLHSRALTSAPVARSDRHVISVDII